MDITMNADIFKPVESVAAAKIDPEARTLVYYYPQYTSF